MSRNQDREDAAVHTTATLQMEPSQDLETVTLTRTDIEGKSHSIILTSKDIFSLAPKMPQFAAKLAVARKKEILAKDPDLQVVATLRAKSRRTSVDLHNQMVILEIQDELDQWMNYSLTPEFSLAMAEGLQKYAKQVQNSPPTTH